MGTKRWFSIARLTTLFNKPPHLAEEAALRNLILDSGLFDPEFYLRENPDVAHAGMDPAIHYLRHGAAEFRNPSRAFDTAYYVTRYPDVGGSRLNPLVHYLTHGLHEGRDVRLTTAPAPISSAPNQTDWDRLAAAAAAARRGMPIVDVVIPVYRGFDETANCIYSVVQSRLAAEVPCELVVVDDASPERQLSALLDRLAGMGLFALLRNGRNLGFVESVNRGMALHGDRDVILLNADTEVYGDWVERLRRAVYARADVATATPFSNNATICGYPNFPGDFRGAFEVPFAELDGLAREANAGRSIDLPTAIGFCMYIRRECLRLVGHFDAGAFGLGYGEENDFCLRLAARGWRHMLAGDVFVRHLGRVSFLDETSERVRQGLDVIRVRYPNYLTDVAKFIKADPPRPLRRNLDIARLRRANAGSSVLFVLHHLDGGTPRHVHELAAALAEEGVGALLLRPWPGDKRYVELSHPLLRDLSVVHRAEIGGDLAPLMATLRELGVAHIHVHHLMGFAPEMIETVAALAQAGGWRYDFTTHDYLAVCPRVTMIDGTGRYCDNRELAVCESCVQSNGSPFGPVDVAAWRAAYARFLAGARHVFVPDEDVQQRLAQFLPTLEITVRPHPEPVPEVFALPVARQKGEPLRVAVIGAIGPHKGSLQVQQCAEDAARRQLPIRFMLFGYTDRAELLDLPNVKVIGRYREEELPTLLAREACHLAFFPAVWPETYSYTLSQAFFSGLYPVAFDIGAIARRIRVARWGMVLPFALVDRPPEINDALLGCEVPPMPPDIQISGRRRYREIVSDYYGLDPSIFARSPKDMRTDADL
jgi:GT2 family glycosyltransferase/glycosyltransferase involved in cell wall biosynthesis